MSTIVDVVKSARKMATRTKDEAISIILNGLCDIIEQQDETIKMIKEVKEM